MRDLCFLYNDRRIMGELDTWAEEMKLPMSSGDRLRKRFLA